MLRDLPERSLKRGDVGTVVEVLGSDVFEVEFCDDEGETYAEFAIGADLLERRAHREENEVSKIVDTGLASYRAGRTSSHASVVNRVRKTRRKK